MGHSFDAVSCYDSMCNPEFVAESGYLYGLTFVGVKSYVKRPITSLLVSCFFIAPITMFMTMFIADLMPKRLLGVIPILFVASSSFHFVKALRQ